MASRERDEWDRGFRGQGEAGTAAAGEVDDDEWDEPDPVALRDDLWDVFKLDDEPGELEPEYGDFWPELDDGEST